MVGSCNMLRAPANPVPGAGHVLEASSRATVVGASMVARGKLADTMFFGAVMSEQAVMRAVAMIALRMRGLRRIIEAPELREAVLPGDAFALDPADTAPHDRRAPSTEPHTKLTNLAQRQNVGPRASGNAFPAERDSSGPRIRATKKIVGPARDSRSGWQARISARPHRGVPLARKLGSACSAFARPDG